MLMGQKFGQGKVGTICLFSHGLGPQLRRLIGWGEPDDWGRNHLQVSLLTHVVLEAACQLDFIVLLARTLPCGLSV